MAAETSIAVLTSPITIPHTRPVIIGVNLRVVVAPPKNDLDITSPIQTAIIRAWLTD
jgi:hypothetical protein